MSGPVNIGSTGEWQSLLAGNSVVVADFYADWCGPCKMIAPHFEKLAKDHSSPKKVAFAKVNVDTQSAVAQTNAVSAMPTFKIFHKGNCVDTIKGANPSALSEAVSKAVKLAGAAGGGSAEGFKSAGRTLGDGKAPSARKAKAGAGFEWMSFTSLLNMLINFVGLYLVSLFSTDGRKAAEDSYFNVNKVVSTSKKPSAGNSNRVTIPKSAVKTLADLAAK
ncbi:thioredoxin [Drechmeria coniospora]|uniref:Thioredoxin n=1 Tax=Drechmeria coniospora TaxID=98403 RepID=A0A151GV38_DRECN|nr:thioredoxin [Drechmeria coniospora]KYK60931.1 thioredoxin [Drechmeria coniospora]ODA83619.1 hypothetical protein RJ55_02134 [Drechmeria coniospora]